MDRFNFKNFLGEFEKSSNLDFFSLIDVLREEKVFKTNFKDKGYLKDWIKFVYFLGKIKKITNISKIEGVVPHYFDVNYLKFFMNYLLNSLLSIEAVFIEYFNPRGLDKDKHIQFLNTFISNIDKLLKLAIVKNDSHNLYNLYNLSGYVFYIDYNQVKSRFVPYGLSLDFKQKKIIFYLKLTLILLLLSIISLFSSYIIDLQIIFIKYNFNVLFLLFLVLFFLFLITFFSLLNWYYNVSKLKDLYEYFSLMLDLSELELIGINDENNQVELKKVIMNNITSLIGSIDDIYNKSLVKFGFKSK